MSQQGMPLAIDVLSVGDAGTALWLMIKKWNQENINNRLPCIVTAVSDTDSTVTVVPLVSMLNTLNETFSRGEKLNVTVLSLGTSRAFIQFKVEVGDVGWIEASDRDFTYVIQAIKAGQDKTELPPPTLRNFDWSSSRFMADYMLSHAFSGDMYFGNKDGTVSIEYGPGQNMTFTAGAGTPKGVARVGDTVNAIVPAGTFVISVTGGPSAVVVTMNEEITLVGEITSSSTTIKAN